MKTFFATVAILLPLAVTAAQDKKATEAKAAEAMATKLLASPQLLADWHFATRKQQGELNQKQDYLGEKQLGDQQVLVFDAMKGKSIAWPTKVTARFIDGTILVVDSWPGRPPPAASPTGGGPWGVKVTYLRMKGKIPNADSVKIGEEMILRGTVDSFDLLPNGHFVTLHLKDATISPEKAKK